VDAVDKARRRAVALAAPLIAAAEKPGATERVRIAGEMARLLLDAAEVEATHVPQPDAWSWYAGARMLSDTEISRLNAARAVDEAAGRIDPQSGARFLAAAASKRHLDAYVRRFDEWREDRATRAWRIAQWKIAAVRDITARRRALERLLDS